MKNSKPPELFYLQRCFVLHLLQFYSHIYSYVLRTTDAQIDQIVC